MRVSFVTASIGREVISSKSSIIFRSCASVVSHYSHYVIGKSPKLLLEKYSEIWQLIISLTTTSTPNITAKSYVSFSRMISRNSSVHSTTCVSSIRLLTETQTEDFVETHDERVFPGGKFCLDHLSGIIHIYDASRAILQVMCCC